MQPITAIALDRILAFLAPLFLTGAGGDLPAARIAAAETLHAYAARTDQEIRLIALVIAFNQRALDAMARAAEPGLDVKMVLRLNNSAATLNRAALRCQRELDKLRAQAPAEQPQPSPVSGPIPAVADLPGLLAFAESTLSALRPASVPAAAPSRAQRRAEARQAEKERRRQQERAQQAQRAALRAGRGLEAAV